MFLRRRCDDQVTAEVNLRLWFLLRNVRRKQIPQIDELAGENLAYSLCRNRSKTRGQDERLLERRREETRGAEG